MGRFVENILVVAVDRLVVLFLEISYIDWWILSTC